MAFLFRDRGVSESKRQAANPKILISDLAYPFGKLSCDLSDPELREIAYEIFLAACRSSLSMPLLQTPEQSDRDSAGKPEKSILPPPQASSPSPQRSATSSAASKMKAALGFSSYSSKSLGKENSPLRPKKPVTAGELMRVQMSVSEEADSRVRRAVLRITGGLHGRSFESMVLPVELLQQLRASDFPDQQQYTAWQMRSLKVLEAGLLMHPFKPLENPNSASQQLRQIICGASDRPIETGKNSELMQGLRDAVTSLACRSFDGSVPETCHWADGFPLNLRLYQMLLEACFDCNEETSIIDEVDELIELIKKTWVVLGMNQVLHNLCFSWVLFNRFVTTGEVENELLFAAENQLAEVAKDEKIIKDPAYSEIFNSTLGSILGWVEKRLLAYHDTFHPGNVSSMQSIVSLGVLSGKILEGISRAKNSRRRREQVDVARNKIEIYIKSSLQTAFAQGMEKVASSRRSSKTKPNPTPFLCILAKDIGDLARKEKEVFSPILKRWHPLAAGVAVTTLHRCYGNELKQLIQRVTELTPDTVQVFEVADKLEKELVQIAVEDSVNSEDGGKTIIREMQLYEAEYAVANLAKAWIKTRVNRLKEWIDKNVQLEVWNPMANKDKFAPSSIEVLRITDETLHAFFQLPMTMHQALLPDLITGIDQSLQHYISRAKSGCGTRNTYIPTMPALTRCEIGSKLQGVFKKKENLQGSHQRNSQVGALNGHDSFGLVQLCVRMNTLYHIRTELETLEKRIVTYLRNTKSSHIDTAKGVQNKFELSLVACQEGIQQLCEVTAFKVVFHDLSHVLWDGLYVGDVAISRIEPFCRELDTTLDMISSTVHNQLCNSVVTTLMKASFDGFLLVLLAGGPSRAFSRQDCQIIEEDFVTLKDLYMCNGDRLPEDLVEKAATPVRRVLPLFQADTENLIERFRRLAFEAYGPSAKSNPPLPPTPGNWNPTEPNTLLRVLCYRNDETASKFLKKTYNLPKKL
ncbi:protein unc-13 homolog isoform X2 [Magnolia sinica]|uniref:protein unc-13 homolog isoform X2 n=1 Tax=Magnolia sinica TaxID=86752 RepID=UPI002658A35C|nr:protein unc-13 homolog isoform X2 [Magnolia sinica]